MAIQARNIMVSNYIEDEIKHLRNIDAIKKIAIQHIDEKIDSAGLFDIDDDSDSENSILETVEFEFMDIRVWCDIEIKNESYQIECIDVKSNNDDDYIYVASWLKQELTSYYDIESIQRLYSYKQSLEILHDQNDLYGIRPKMLAGHNVNVKHIENIKAICEDEEIKVIMFIKHGYTGKKLRLKPRTKNTDLVKTILPMVMDNTFEQFNRRSDKKEIAQLIYDNFANCKGENLKMKTILNQVSAYF